MPELPEVEAIADFLRQHALGHTIARVDIASLSVLKTAVPPWTELAGREITGIARHGKHLDIDCAGLHLIIHLARAGWLRWSDDISPTPLKPGKGPLALRVRLDNNSGFDLTEAGTKKGLAVWIVNTPAEVSSIARLGPDALSLDRQQLESILSGRTGRLKTVLTDQSIIAGIGNAYSDEILHVAQLSPYAVPNKLSAVDLDRLTAAIHDVLSGAIARSVGQSVARLKGEKRSGLRVHNRAGLPCPICGDTVREISLADKAFQYCPTCQTGGRLLADRRMSRLLK